MRRLRIRPELLLLFSLLSIFLISLSAATTSPPSTFVFPSTYYPKRNVRFWLTDADLVRLRAQRTAQTQPWNGNMQQRSFLARHT